MKDPRSVSANPHLWLTDSRVYNLLWLGRWMERAENLLRALDSAVNTASISGGDQAELQKSVGMVATAWGIPMDGEVNPVTLILQGEQASSVCRSLQNARDNATQVAPVEFIQAINRVLDHVLEFEIEGITVDEFHQRLTQLLNEVLEAYQVVENSWFRSAPISEEEVYRRFLQ